MLYKKLHIPINLPLLDKEEVSFDLSNLNLINKIKNSNNIGMSSTILLFKNYFSSNISKFVKPSLDLFLDKIIPILFESKYKEEGLYQLLRFIDKTVFNFPYIEALKDNSFVYQNLAKVLLFSGYVTNILTQDKKILDILQPEYAMRLNGNISFYKNTFSKIDIHKLNEEEILNTLRRNHRFLKFQILFAIINKEIDIQRASNEFSLLAQATFNIALDIAQTQISNKYNINCEEYSAIAYGRFATFSMTANSDLDLVFIYEDSPVKISTKKNVYIELFRQLIKLLSVKTSEGFMYEVDTKLRPSGKEGPIACTYDNFREFHEKNSFSWEKLALRKTRVVNENKFSIRVFDLLNDLNSKPISQKKIVNEINLMRTNTKSSKTTENRNNSTNNQRSKWFETKYVGGGQREIEYLNFFYNINSNFTDDYETSKKILLNKKIEKLFFKLDQIVNICFENEKQDYLPTTAVILITIETNEKDLGSLKALVNFSKQEIYKNLNQVLESIKNNPNLTF